MNQVSFDEVEDIFHDIWCNSSEHFFHEIAWDCLERAGLTTYSNEKTYALIYVYAYVIQMLCEEFSYVAYDELCEYNYELPEEEPLTDAAIGWLYRDCLSKEDDAADEYFSTDARDMLVDLMKQYRDRVADAIFEQLGEPTVGALLLFSIRGKRFAEDCEDEYEIENFQSKEGLLNYSKSIGINALEMLSEYNGMQVWSWLETHSDSINE